MTRRILFHNMPYSYLIGALLGGFVGFIVLMLTFQTWEAYNNLINSNENQVNQYITINKRVGLANSLRSDLSNFSKKEIDNIKNKPFIDDVGAFVRSTFGVEAKKGASQNMPYMRTEMFFEAVPDRFLDIHPSDWYWTNDRKEIPIIIPKEYLNLYNFGFAKSQGLPNISANLVGNFTFDIDLYNNTRIEHFKGRVVGFSNRIETLLVPLDFLESANSRFSNQKENRPDRLIIKLAPNKEKELYNFLDKNGYETTHDAFQGGKVSMLVYIASSAILFIAIIIILLALIVYSLAIQLTVYRNRNEIYLLILLGYKPKHIWLSYFVFQTLSALLILAISSIIVSVVSNIAINYIYTHFNTTLNMGNTTYIIGFCISILFILVVGLNSNKLIKRISTNGI